MKAKLLRAFLGVLIACTMFASVSIGGAQITDDQLSDCEIKVKGVFNGTAVNVVITVYDVSWGECLLLKTAAALSTPKK